MRIEGNPFYQKINELTEQNRKTAGKVTGTRTNKSGDTTDVSLFQSKFLEIDNRLKDTQSRFSLLQILESEDIPQDLGGFIREKASSLGIEDIESTMPRLFSADVADFASAVQSYKEGLQQEVASLEVESENLTAGLGSGTSEMDAIRQMDSLMRQSSNGLQPESVLRLLGN
jgi:hypothetical protein